MRGPVPDEDFHCAICGFKQQMRWNRYGPDMIVPPLCRSCERHYSLGNGNAVNAGAFADRRFVRQGFALAEAVHSQAGMINWENRHGRA